MSDTEGNDCNCDDCTAQRNYEDESPKVTKNVAKKTLSKEERKQFRREEFYKFRDLILRMEDSDIDNISLVDHSKINRIHDSLLKVLNRTEVKKKDTADLLEIIKLMMTIQTLYNTPRKLLNDEDIYSVRSASIVNKNISYKGFNITNNNVGRNSLDGVRNRDFSNKQGLDWFFNDDFLSKHIMVAGGEIASYIFDGIDQEVFKLYVYDIEPNCFENVVKIIANLMESFYKCKFVKKTNFIYMSTFELLSTENARKLDNFIGKTLIIEQKVYRTKSEILHSLYPGSSQMGYTKDDLYMTSRCLFSYVYAHNIVDESIIDQRYIKNLFDSLKYTRLIFPHFNKGEFEYLLAHGEGGAFGVNSATIKYSVKDIHLDVIQKLQNEDLDNENSQDELELRQENFRDLFDKKPIICKSNNFNNLFESFNGNAREWYKSHIMIFLQDNDDGTLVSTNEIKKYFGKKSFDVLSLLMADISNPEDYLSILEDEIKELQVKIDDEKEKYFNFNCTITPINDHVLEHLNRIELNKRYGHSHHFELCFGWEIQRIIWIGVRKINEDGSKSAFYGFPRDVIGMITYRILKSYEHDFINIISKHVEFKTDDYEKLEKPKESKKPLAKKVVAKKAFAKKAPTKKAPPKIIKKYSSDSSDSDI